MATEKNRPAAGGVESSYAWARLMVSLLLGAVGGVGFWSVVVVLPTVQAEFGVDRGSASIPYTAAMLGFAAGGVLMGRLSDRFGIVVPVLLGAVAICIGYVGSSFATSIWQFALFHGVFIGLLGSSAVFGPLIADISHWFNRRRGIAVGICASGNYLAGTIWPSVIQALVADHGWRFAHVVVGITCVVLMLPLALFLRRRPPPQRHAAATAGSGPRPVGLSPNRLQLLLAFAGIACCIAMSMPQVHIVAYCGDLGYGVARGAEMLSLMLGFGIVSRLASGWISDRIGGVRTLLLGSALQGLTLSFYLPFDGLTSLYVVSALFGLAQGGIVPSYAIIVREYMPAAEAGTRVGVVLMATIVGMAIGGWMSGVIFDVTGSYQAAFVNGLAWNLVNVAIGVWLLTRGRPSRLASA
jgi:MFS family permease